MQAHPTTYEPRLHSFDDGDLVFAATNLGRRAIERPGPEEGPGLRSLPDAAEAGAPEAGAAESGAPVVPG